MSIHASIKTTGMKEIQSLMKRASRNSKGVESFALKKVGFKYRRPFASEIARGRPGGEQLAPLRVVTKRKREKAGIRSRQALTPFGRFVRFAVIGKALEIGILERGPGAASPEVVKKYRRVIEGFTESVQRVTRKYFGFMGRKKGQKRGKVYALKKTTTQLTTPPRPVVSKQRRRHLKSMLDDFNKVVRGRLFGNNVRL